MVGANARERILGTAYELFTRHGVHAVGVDRIVAEAGVAKTTLYRNFRSKDELVVAVLQRHEQLWTQGWFEPEATRLASSPGGSVLGIFDVLDDWFRQADFAGCFFINTLLETRDPSCPVHTAAVTAIENIYGIVKRLAEETGVEDSKAFAYQMQILMRGSIVAATEGRLDAARHALIAARRLLEG